jgi:hypothetical protein
LCIVPSPPAKRKGVPLSHFSLTLENIGPSFLVPLLSSLQIAEGLREATPQQWWPEALADLCPQFPGVGLGVQAVVYLVLK